MPSATAQLKTNPEQVLRENIASFRHDPVGYVRYVFPWGEGSLSGFDGPDDWQHDYLVQLRDEIRKRNFDWTNPTPVKPIQMATASGHGIGKSALTAWLVCFILDTRPMSKIIVTANTGEQLRTKTFAEIAKWRKRSLTEHWWDVSTGDMYVRSKELPTEWRCDAVTWRKENSEAFAGLHAINSTPAYIFDEGSAVHDIIFDVAQGGLTDGEPMFFLFGNPTRNQGAFFECFHKNRHRWITRQIDSRDCRFPNKLKISEWQEDYGEDSDFFRVRVRGVFPKVGSKQLIGNDVVRAAQVRDLPYIADDEPTIMFIDIARFGEDESVIGVRRGFDARSIPWDTYRGLDTMQLAARAAEKFDHLSTIGIPPVSINCDGGGVGGGVIDRLRQLGYPVLEVNFGGRADNPQRFLRKDAEMWLLMKHWLEQGCIPEDPVLADQLTHRIYEYNHHQQLWLWPKDRMKTELGVDSPDRADGLALSFAAQFMAMTPQELREIHKAKHDYNPLEDTR